MIAQIVLVCAGLLPLAVLFSGLYESQPEQIAMVTGNVGLLVGVFFVSWSDATVPSALRLALFVVVTLSFVYHTSAAVRTKLWPQVA